MPTSQRRLSQPPCGSCRGSTVDDGLSASLGRAMEALGWMCHLPPPKHPHHPGPTSTGDYTHALPIHIKNIRAVLFAPSANPCAPALPAPCPAPRATLSVVSREELSRKLPEGWNDRCVTAPLCAL